MSEWFYQLLGETIGPISWEELCDKAQGGEIDSATPVRQGAQGEWKKASTVPELFKPGGVEPAEMVATSDRSTADGERVKVGDELPSDSGPMRRSPLALRPCADCGYMVSRQANLCPNCGRLFHEASSVIRYRGEHPVPVLVFFSVLAVLFAVVTPIVVYVAASALLNRSLEDPEMAGGVALGVTVLYIVSMVVCALLGGAVGRPRMAYLTGLFLGLFFGPLGVFTAYAIDKRPQCYHCFSRLDGLARECPYCHARLLWRVETMWY